MILKTNIRQKLEELMQSFHPDFEAKMKFGSRGYELNGNLCVGVFQDMLVINLGKERVSEMLLESHTKKMDIIGRVLEDWIMLEEPIYQDEVVLKKLLDEACARVRVLEPKF
jgi:hypothetical protein